nr:hypothetical protein [uncultured Cohaesibacter sp.]
MAKRKQSKAKAVSKYTGMHWKEERRHDEQGRPQILFFIGMSKSNSVTLAPVRGWFQ